MASFPFQIVGFDLDGTLLDTAADLGNAVNHALKLAGRPPVTLDQVPSLVGGGTRLMLERAFAVSGGIDKAQAEELYGDLLRYYEEHTVVHTRLYAGGEAMLAALEERGCTLAVVTNKLERFAVKVLDELGLLPRFATVIGGDTLGPGRAKPARDMIDAMVARCGGGPAAFVGDTSYDVLAARAAEVPCVAVTWGFSDVPAEELGAHAVIGHFDELVQTLERL